MPKETERFLYDIYKDTLAITRAIDAMPENRRDELLLTDPRTGQHFVHADVQRVAKALGSIIHETLSEALNLGSMVRSLRDGLDHSECVGLSSDHLIASELTLNIAAGHAAYAAGYDARSDGCSFASNPHDINSNSEAYEHLNWADGWRDRDREELEIGITKPLE